jgi:hypothetical protein
MRRSAIFGAFVCAWPVFGQAGALPRARLAEAEQMEADARDEAVLRRTLFGGARIEELTPEDGVEMSAAARRRFERRQARVERTRKLVEAGAAPRLSLTPLLEELERSRAALELAGTRAGLIAQLLEIAQRERDMLARSAELATGPAPLIERYAGRAPFREGDLAGIQQAYRREFSKALPVSANGATAVHRSLGYDHRGRVDVALDPDQPEGVWLRRLLESQNIPYFAFRSSVPGRATGPHIHIGPPSERVAHGG